MHLPPAEVGKRPPRSRLRDPGRPAGRAAASQQRLTLHPRNQSGGPAVRHQELHMSTIMVDAAASERLSRQFAAVMRRGTGREAHLEARRFISYLCDRLERNNHALMAAARNRRPDQLFNTAYASRQGEGVMMTCLFLLNDLAARMGNQRVADCLTATRTRAGRALAKRIGGR